MRIDEAAIRKYCKNKPHVALTIATHEKGVDAVRSYGDEGVPVAPETRAYEIGSISKVFLSTLLAKCVEEGELSLDDTIDRYIDLPSACVYPSILRLAAHTSGYTDPALFDTALEALSWSLSPVKKQSNPFDDFRSEWLVGAIADASCKRRKKEGRFQYSNFGYSVLGYALGRAMGSTYHDLIVSYIENELRLSSTTFGPGRLPMVHGFKKGRDCGNWKWSEDSAYAPAGCLCSDAADLLSFAKMNLYDEKSYLTLSHRKQVSEKTLDVGLGWIGEKDGDILWHNGQTGMFHCFLGFSKSKERAVVLLSNCIKGFMMPEDGIALSILKSV